MEKTNPCPFCGSEKVEIIQPIEAYKVFGVLCTKCIARGPAGKTKAAAMVAWNGAGRWTSVEDGLPEGRNKWGSAWWLVKTPKTIPSRAMFSDGAWYAQAAGGGTYRVFPTHWMPLPDPPEDNRD